MKNRDKMVSKQDEHMKFIRVKLKEIKKRNGEALPDNCCKTEIKQPST